MEVQNLISFAGIFVLMGFAWVFSANRWKMNWRAIVWGTALQLIFAFFVFVVPVGSAVFLYLNNLAVRVMDCAAEGALFLFGRLALPPGAKGKAGEESLGFILAFQAFPTIIFFSALMSILYYCNIMPLLIRAFARVFTRLMRISGAESLCASSNIFVGVESALTIRPYLERMTRSELCTVLAAGMATVSSNILAVYVFSLRQYFPTIAGHLISASVLSAPAAIVMSKILLPESETPDTLGVSVKPHYDRENNVLEAIINGANAGVRLIAGIVALLVAVLGLVAALDWLLGAAGGRLNALAGIHFDWSLKELLGYLFYPFSWVLGVASADVGIVSRIIGERAILTEVTAYQDLAVALAQGLVHHPRSVVITTYALCGFAHIPSMAIFVGGVAALAPSKTRVLAEVGFRALVAATLACLMTACVAGTFFTQGSVLFQK